MQRLRQLIYGALCLALQLLQPDLIWDLRLYERLARADAWASMFDRLVCMNGGNPART
ncbi:hypothetical protein AB4099_33855 [Bosea sp. 2KB_26]|uniref:hypothetical protein n=1 Tax=Bosea sp. 2KB_26 TaxID=3237475 RepID=UPI003F927EF7